MASWWSNTGQYNPYAGGGGYGMNYGFTGLMGMLPMTTPYRNQSAWGMQPTIMPIGQYNTQGLGGYGGYGGGGYGGYGNYTTGGGGSLADLIAEQRSQNAWAREQQLAAWNEGKGLLGGVMPGYDVDPMNIGARGLASRLIAQPESISDEVQQLILNKARNQTDAMANANLRRGRAALMEGGQLDAGSLAALTERSERERMAGMRGLTSDLEIERARARTGDITNAAQLASGLGMQRAGLSSQVARDFLQNMPQFRADDLTGLAALLMAASGQGSTVRGSQRESGLRGEGQWVQGPDGWQWQQAGMSPYDYRGGFGDFIW
jgi:hypothetical protein